MYLCVYSFQWSQHLHYVTLFDLIWRTLFDTVPTLYFIWAVSLLCESHNSVERPTRWHKDESSVVLKSNWKMCLQLLNSVTTDSELLVLLCLTNICLYVCKVVGRLTISGAKFIAWLKSQQEFEAWRAALTPNPNIISQFYLYSPVSQITICLRGLSFNHEGLWTLIPGVQVL